MKGDTFIRAPRASWERWRAFAKRAGRTVREVTTTAVDAYVQREEKEASKR
jgi:hypothetical protein